MTLCYSFLMDFGMLELALDEFRNFYSWLCLDFENDWKILLGIPPKPNKAFAQFVPVVGLLSVNPLWAYILAFLSLPSYTFLCLEQKYLDPCRWDLIKLNLDAELCYEVMMWNKCGVNLSNCEWKTCVLSEKERKIEQTCVSNQRRIKHEMKKNCDDWI